MLLVKLIYLKINKLFYKSLIVFTKYNLYLEIYINKFLLNFLYYFRFNKY